MPDLDSVIRKHVLKNAHDYGEANAGSVAGKVIGEFPDCKKDMKGTIVRINEEITRVSKLTKEELAGEMASSEYTVKKEEKKALELPEAVQGKVVTRFPPEPSGYPHIGHAKAAWLDYESAQAYGGKMLLRFDDTNPEKEAVEFVDAIKAGLRWLGISWAAETYTSDNLPAIYEAAAALVRKGDAYVCTCPQEEISKGRSESRACPCRALPVDDQLGRWQQMLEGGFKGGEAVLRFKADLKADNTVMRDPSLARIIAAKHYRQGDRYHVWPSYDLAVCVMDHCEGITHSMRSKEYELRDELSLALYRALGWPAPVLIGFSRLAIKNAPISKRLLLPLVKENKVMGWDDPRLPTLAGMRRRGIQPAAIKDFVLSFGLSKVESEPDLEALLSQNRKLLDPVSPHHFFVAEPVELEVRGLTERTVELKLHPKAGLGVRPLRIGKIVYVARKDADSLAEGETFRLKDLCNVKLVKKGKALSGELAPDGAVPKKIQWVSEGKLGCEVLVPKDLLGADGEFDPKSIERVDGYCESACASLTEGAIVQFERFGFCRLDRKDGGRLTFVFSC
jgi:glutamyl-tRNA synthetase